MISSLQILLNAATACVYYIYIVLFRVLSSPFTCRDWSLTFILFYSSLRGKSKENIYAPLSLWQLAECVPSYLQIITSLFILYTFVVVLLFCLELYPA